MTRVLCGFRLSLGGEGSAFEQQASSAVLDLMGDEADQFNQHKKIMKWWKPLTCSNSLSPLLFLWHLLILPLHIIIRCLLCRDRKRKRFVRESGPENHKHKVHTDSGQVISNKKNKKNLYPNIFQGVCLLILQFVLLLHCTYKYTLRYCLTLMTCQLWGVEEKVQVQWRRRWIGWRNRRRKKASQG